MHLGCGHMIFSEFVNCDLHNPKADVQCDAQILPFKSDSVNEIYTSHLIEHFDYYEAFKALTEWKRVLKIGGLLRIETPDFLNSCKALVEAERNQPGSGVGLYPNFFGYPWEKGQTHKFLYTETQLRWTLERVGFREVTTVPALRYIGLEKINLGMVAFK